MSTATLIPSAVTLTGLTGTVAAIQDSPTAPDATWLMGTNGTAGHATIDFANPTNFLSGVQTFRFFLRKSSGTSSPTFSVNLWNNGVNVATLADKVALTTTTGQLYTYTWNASQVTFNGTNVQARVTTNLGGGAQSTRATVEIGAAEWVADLSDWTLWDGTAEQWLRLDGTWNGSAIIATTVEGVTV